MKQSILVRTINGADITFDPIATAPDVPGTTSGSSVFAGNVVADASCSIYPDPANNFCPTSTDWQAQFVDYAAGDLRLRDGSRFKAVGTGTDLGANVVDVDALTSVAPPLGRNETIPTGGTARERTPV